MNQFSDNFYPVTSKWEPISPPFNRYLSIFLFLFLFLFFFLDLGEVFGQSKNSIEVQETALSKRRMFDEISYNNILLIISFLDEYSLDSLGKNKNKKVSKKDLSKYRLLSAILFSKQNSIPEEIYVHKFNKILPALNLLIERSNFRLMQHSEKDSLGFRLINSLSQSEFGVAACRQYRLGLDLLPYTIAFSLMANILNLMAGPIMMVFDANTNKINLWLYTMIGLNLTVLVQMFHIFDFLNFKKHFGDINSDNWILLNHEVTRFFKKIENENNFVKLNYELDKFLERLTKLGFVFK
jgi:hypothetical protein